MESVPFEIVIPYLDGKSLLQLRCTSRHLYITMNREGVIRVFCACHDLPVSVTFKECMRSYIELVPDPTILSLFDFLERTEERDDREAIRRLLLCTYRYKMTKKLVFPLCEYLMMKRKPNTTSVALILMINDKSLVKNSSGHIEDYVVLSMEWCNTQIIKLVHNIVITLDGEDYESMMYKAFDNLCSDFDAYAHSKVIGDDSLVELVSGLYGIEPPDDTDPEFVAHTTLNLEFVEKFLPEKMGEYKALSARKDSINGIEIQKLLCVLSKVFDEMEELMLE